MTNQYMPLQHMVDKLSRLIADENWCAANDVASRIQSRIHNIRFASIKAELDAAAEACKKASEA